MRMNPQQLALFDKDAPEFVKPLSDYDMADFVQHADFYHGSTDAAELQHDRDTVWGQRNPTMHAGSVAAAEHRATNNFMSSTNSNPYIHPLIVPPEHRAKFRVHAGRIQRDRLDNTVTDEDDRKAGLDYRSWERNGPIYYKNEIEDAGSLSVVAPIDQFQSYGGVLRAKEQAGQRLTARQAADAAAGHTYFHPGDLHDESTERRDSDTVDTYDASFASSLKHFKRRFNG